MPLFSEVCYSLMITIEPIFPSKKGKMPLIFNYFIALKFATQSFHINGILKINITQVSA